MKKAGVNVKLVLKLTVKGWNFWLSTWEDRHKFEEFNELRFQSPNMRNDASIHPSYFGEMSEEYLFEREAFAVSLDWVDGVFNHKLVIQNPISSALREYFKKEKNCEFKNIWSTDVDFDVKISPKKKHLPKKIKVTIEIE